VRFLILSDIHANWEALEAVLTDSAGEYDRILCCGDVVGYNPNPAEVVEWARRNCHTVIRGNHDKAVAGIEGLEWFNEVAQSAALWARAQLNDDQLAWLRDLPAGPVVVENCTVMHGAPFDEDYYLATLEDVAACHSFLATPLSFFGHTHLQGAFFFRGRRLGRCPPLGEGHRDTVIQLDPDSVFIVNPGSVGQPRDGDPRAGYAIWNNEEKTVTLRRIVYPVETTCRKISESGLPDLLAARLEQGL
jgi:diadenosine tetraphosphatase ApaH/serine/threonine PP2A family protein phosphatase